jgi:predicted amidohydrolase
LAAIHYTDSGARAIDPSCEDADSNCATEALVRRAHAAGARLVVTAEYALRQTRAEPVPTRGSPVTDADHSPLQARFSQLAAELSLYLVINLRTLRGAVRHNSQVAFGPDGSVVGVHHKFELYGGENEVLEAGEDVSVFDTPFGRVGLLICADLYGDPTLHDRLTRVLGADVVAVSSMWTVAGATRWQAAFARDWGTIVVAANSSAGAGRGSGIFDARGRALAETAMGSPSVLLAELPESAPAANR